jgi:hypothetical protein
VPSAWSVVAPIVPVLVPPERENTTAARVDGVPAASFACNVSVIDAPDATVVPDTLTSSRRKYRRR